MKRALSLVASATLIAGALFAPARAQDAPAADGAVTVKAGYGEADATWHVGAGAGQHADKGDPLNLTEGGEGGLDPHNHSTTQKNSEGVQSRLSYRAIVVQDGDGDQVAFVKSDSYLAQDYLARRVGQILEAEGSNVGYEEIFHMASHNHSSPYYTTPSWGVFVFQDVFDLRAFEYHARQMAAAILEAEGSMVDARMGATTITHRLFKGQVQSKSLADDGTPRGYPDDFGDMGLSILRFDSLEDPANPAPLATLINWGQHPEGLSGHDLITGDFVAPLERFVEEWTGAPVVFGQGDVGSAERGPGRPDLVRDDIPKKWYHVGFAQAERGAFLLAEDVAKGFEAIGAGNAIVEYDSSFDVAAGNAFVPGPLSHPYPSVSNCRTETTAEGGPGAPVAGLPDCERGPFESDKNNMMWENLKAHGIPVPEHYDAPSFTGVEENLRLKLQAFKVGEVLLASCACEAQVDLILNLETRADEEQGNMWLGYDWTETLGCKQATEGGDWTCRDFSGNGTITFSDARYQRMRAQIHNDAAGWDAPEYVPFANSEPSNPEEIKGNFTHEELPADLGYKLPIGVGHAGDYNGYTVSYREYMADDGYRKALTPYGPHTADYMVTRLVRLAGELNGGPPLDPEPHDVMGQADEARMVAASTALGAASSSAYDSWQAALPDDAGPAAALTKPENIKRFDGTTFTWRGGSNAVDNPVVTVERRVNGGWEAFADQSGEIQTELKFPEGANAFFDTYSGAQEWLWTANFEAFDPAPHEIGNTPSGEYRFVVDGSIRSGGATEPYHVESESFTVRPWDGIEVTDVQAGEDGSISFSIPPIRYPQTYESEFGYVKVAMTKDEEGRSFCMTCSFRPWATVGEVATATVTVERANGSTEQVAASRTADGRWIAPTNLYDGDRAYVARGGVVDTFGEINGERSTEVTGTRARPARATTLSLVLTGSGPTTSLNAQLLDNDGAAVTGRDVLFYAGSTHIGTAVTGASGTATLAVPRRYRGARTYEARFEGDAQYLASSARITR